MKTKLLALAIALSCTFAGSAMATTKVEYKTEKDRISGDYKVAKDKCGALKANAKDICMSEAKGAERVAKAEAETAYKPTARNTEKVGMAKAYAMYSIAKEKCDDLSGNAKDVCVKDAKVVYTKAKDDAKIAKVSMDTSKSTADKMADVKKDANSDENKAMYKAAAERCDALAGAPKDTCVNDAKVKFGMK
jgi:hypothetical protein